MILKVYFTFPKAPELDPRYHMQFSVIPRTLTGESDLSPLQWLGWVKLFDLVTYQPLMAI